MSYTTDQLVDWVEEWWDHIPPGEMRRTTKQAKLSTDDRNRWNARDWERIMDYYVQVMMNDPRGYQRGRNV